MSDISDEVSELLEEKPEMESGLEELLEIDEDKETWVFEDIPLDSGNFGELVSRGIVEKKSDEYRLADRQAVGDALGVEVDSTYHDAGDANAHANELSLPNLKPELHLSRTGLATLLSSLAALVLLRSYVYPKVFRGKDVVFLGNDPYFYSYWVQKTLSESSGPLGFGAFTNVPDGITSGEPLMVATLSFVSNILGATEHVIAWYPVASAVITALIIYLVALRLTNDRRVALASVALFALTPAHALRTSLGFADHHPFDYPWLALTAYALVTINRNDNIRNNLKPAGILGIAVASQTLAWDASPILLIPLGIYVASLSVSDLSNDRSPLERNLSIGAGLLLASILTLSAHIFLGWHTTIVATAPVLLFVGVAGVTLVSEGFHRFELPAWSLGLTYSAGAVAGWFVFQTFLPEYVSRFIGRFSFLIGNSSTAVETRSLAWGTLGPFLGPLVLFGFLLFLALFYMGSKLWKSYSQGETEWLPISVYAWYFLVLAFFQRRFTGELSVFVALFAGFGFIRLAYKLDMLEFPSPDTKIELPDRQTAMYISVLFILIAGYGIVQSPLWTNKLVVPEERYEAAKWIESDASDAGLEYPENYVLSSWGRNRFYNYYVNGESQSYAYARSNYNSFINSLNPDKWYDRFKGRVGYIVIDSSRISGDMKPNSTSATLYHRWGSERSQGGAGAVSHYRGVYTTGPIKVFRPVQGARIVGKAASNSKLNLSVSVEIEGAGTVEYTRTVKVGDDGKYSVRVPYPGEYVVGNTTVRVSERDVKEGRKVDA